jgi:hypothetical protein
MLICIRSPMGLASSLILSLSLSVSMKSTGQGNLFSKSDPQIFENDTCIVSRLQSRSLTGCNIQIKVHRHYGDTIQLFWQTKTCDLGTRTIEEFDQMRNFCRTLIGLENLCSCIDPWCIYSTRKGAKFEPYYAAHYYCKLPNGIRLETREHPQTISLDVQNHRFRLV